MSSDRAVHIISRRARRGNKMARQKPTAFEEFDAAPVNPPADWHRLAFDRIKQSPRRRRSLETLFRRLHPIRPSARNSWPGVSVALRSIDLRAN